MHAAAQHLAKQCVVDPLVQLAKLARGADQNLSGCARLHVAGYGFGRQLLGALHVPKLHHLMAQEARIAIGNSQVAFARRYGQARCGKSRLRASRVYEPCGRKQAAIGKPYLARRHMRHRMAEVKHHAQLDGLIEHPAHNDRRKDDCVLLDNQSASQTAAQIGLGRGQSGCGQQLRRNATAGQKLLLARGLLHLFVVFGHPERAGIHVLGLRGQVQRQPLPELLRVAAKGELGVAAVEHHQMPHAGCGCAATPAIPFDQGNREA